VGRPPLPSALKLIRGTARADRTNPAEPTPDIGAKPPPWLPKTGPSRAAWRRLSRVLTATRVLTVADAEALALGCVAIEDYIAARGDPTAWRRADAAWKRYLAVLSAFGLTPSARTRVSAVPEPEHDALAEWEARETSFRPPDPPKPRKRPTKPADPPADPIDPIEAWQRGLDITGGTSS
jgi:phage terminase small subunit